MAEITIKYLAQKLNLAPSTVSRALNDSHEISDATKMKVLALAEELNFQPNPYARSLREQKSKTIGVIIPERINNFFSQVIDGMESVTRAYGYHLLVYNSNEDTEQEKNILSLLIGGRVDAIVMSISRFDQKSDHIDKLKKRNTPVVFFDRISTNFPTTKFITNDYEVGYQGTVHLIEKGCKKILFLMLSNENSNGIERLRGFKDALKKKNITFEANWVIECSHSDEKNIALLESIFYKLDRPDGVLASVEKLALATYRALSRTHIKIPEQVRVVSFSNMKIADLLHPPLTTISQPAYEIGEECAKLLIKKLTKKNQPDLEDKIVTIPSVFTERESSK
ncbi:LacI family DNA-binding transcriptional regulator [Belliella aquatica]|uniref:LacI family transcriptional regulator n=1 Tax=Belliella aquatica TaxID=1323734 RepID=A0ABQ1MZF4_9BACT|nr:LacI family DNA-binding transcriptional regulator [Belliella aquatica]MCH7406615.1 LacI family transcriptional regulator [Belliella aquatica]GGC48056.1 LacI family transcriptional regulator [Belliella aquatica]